MAKSAAEQVRNWIMTYLVRFGEYRTHVLDRDNNFSGVDLRISLFTDNNEYVITARNPKLATFDEQAREGKTADLGYLGCIAHARKPRAGEEHRRGSDLADGRLDRETFVRIMGDIISYEMVKVHRPKEPKRVTPSTPWSNVARDGAEIMEAAGLPENAASEPKSRIRARDVRPGMVLKTLADFSQSKRGDLVHVKGLATGGFTYERFKDGRQFVGQYIWEPWDEFLDFELMSGRGHPIDSAPLPADQHFSEAQIKYMVDRFLGWRLPEEFHPDAGISFERYGNRGTPHQYEHRPTGTNLFDAVQADAMVRHMIEGMPSAAPNAVPLRTTDREHRKEELRRMLENESCIQVSPPDWPLIDELAAEGYVRDFPPASRPQKTYRFAYSAKRQS